MRLRVFLKCFGAVGVSLVIANTAPAQVPPTPPPPTVWNFLGFPTTVDKMRAQVVNRRGNHPNLEKKPPLKTIGDPANLLAPSQPIRAAAEIKQQEDLKLQKIKALKYLASIGCGCYDKEGKVTAALLAGMNDCTEEVRLESVRAITTAAEGGCCQNCKQKSCCNEKITEQLVKMAYQYDDMGCWVEPSERVREAAKQALCTCCPGGPPPIKPYEEPKEEKRNLEGADEKKLEGADDDSKKDDAPPKPPKADTTLLQPVPQQPTTSRRSQSGRNVSTRSASYKPTRLADDDDVPGPPPELLHTVSSRVTLTDEAIETAMSIPEIPSPPPAPMIAPVAPINGNVEYVDVRTGFVHLHLENGEQLQPGTTVRIRHDFFTGSPSYTELEVTNTAPGAADARMRFIGKVQHISRGDRIVSYQ